MKKDDFLSLVTLIVALGGAVGVLALTSGVKLFSPASPTPAVVATGIVTLTSPATRTPTPSPAPMTAWQVCTGVVDGHLHVRNKPGHQTPIRGVLPESSVITPTGQREDDWLAISAPLPGWVHSKFICEVSLP